MAAYTLVTVSRKESLGQDEQTVTRVMDCVPYSARLQAYDDLLGGVRLVGGRLFRKFPARDPDMPWLFVSKVTSEPWGEDYGSMAAGANPVASVEQYQAARLTVEYKQLDFGDGEGDRPGDEQSEKDLATVQWDFSARSLSLPQNWFIWQDGTGAGGPNDGVLANSNTAITKVYPQLQIVVARHLVARRPKEAILGQLGRINRDYFSVGGDKFNPETLRFDSAKSSRKITSKGFKYFELTYTFTCQPIYDLVTSDGTKGFVGWNRLFDPRKGYWRGVKAAIVPPVGGTKFIYDHDEDGPTQNLDGKTVKGFNLLFNPSAK